MVPSPRPVGDGHAGEQAAELVVGPEDAHPRQYTANFKKRVALEALRGDLTVQAIAAKHEIPSEPGGRLEASGNRRVGDGLRGRHSVARLRARGNDPRPAREARRADGGAGFCLTCDQVAMYCSARTVRVVHLVGPEDSGAGTLGGFRRSVRLGGSRSTTGALAYRLRIALRSVSFGPRCTARRGLGGGRRSARRGGPRVGFAAGPGGRPLMTCSARRIPEFVALFSALSVGPYRSAPGADSSGGSLRPPLRGELPVSACGTLGAGVRGRTLGAS